MHTSSPCTTKVTGGGVARNVAKAYSYLREGTEACLLSPGGSTTDKFKNVMEDEANGIDLQLISTDSSSTPLYNALLDPKGKLIVAGADMESASNQQVNEKVQLKAVELLNRGNISVVLCDANLNPETVSSISRASLDRNVPTFFEPTSVPKAKQLFKTYQSFTCISPNNDELMAMAGCLNGLKDEHTRNISEVLSTEPLSVIDAHGGVTTVKLSQIDLFDHDRVLENVMKLLTVTPQIILKLGDRGVLLAQTLNVGPLFDEIEENSGISGGTGQSGMRLDQMETARVYLENTKYWQWSHETMREMKKGPDYVMFRHYLPSTNVANRIVNVTGAGDSMVGGILAGTMDMLQHVDEQFQNNSQSFRVFRKHRQRSFNSSFIKSLDGRVWNALSPLAKFNLVFLNADRNEDREAIMDEIMIMGRRAAEESLICEEAVNPSLKNF
jgi:pseudouridylate synthase / pseudouridine kinase